MPDFTCTLNYSDHKKGDKNPFAYMYQRMDGGPMRSGGARKPVDMLIHDVRPQQTEITLDKNGCALVPHPTSLSREDFYKCPDKIKSVYYAEMEDLVKRATGASRVLVFDHNLRNSEQYLSIGKSYAERTPRPAGFDHPDTQVVGPVVGGPHNDFTVRSAPQRLRDLARMSGMGKEGSFTTSKINLDEDEVEGLLQYQYVFINVWRSFSPVPIQKHPFAVLDASSMSEEDFIESALVFKDRTGYTYGIRHEPQHRWIYFGEMRRDEALLLKVMDSKEAPGVARWTTHTGVFDPKTPQDAPPRESIEARCIAFFAPGDPEYTDKNLLSPPGSSGLASKL